MRQLYTQALILLLLPSSALAQQAEAEPSEESAAHQSNAGAPHIAESQSFFNGSANYNYPIAVPGGTAGMQPSIGLSYGSQSKWSQTGYGWSLSGLDAIRRSTKCGVPTLDDTDTFVWQGEDLVEDTNGVFHTKKETFARIQKLGEGATSHWLVTTPDGVSYRYGATENSRILSFEDPSIVHRWALDRVQDPNGNYYAIEYLRDTDSATYYPKTITYTFNDTAPLQAYRTVEFAWQPRPDIRTIYAESTRQTTNLRLASIASKIDGKLVARHQLHYTLSAGGKSLLTSIQLFGSDGVTSMPATTFRYSEGQRKFGPPVEYGDGQGMYLSTSNRGDTKMHIDINGDGLSDEVSRDGGPRSGTTHPFKIRLGTGSGFQDPIEWPEATKSMGITHRLSHKQALYAQKELRDMNGDGLPDIIERVDGPDRALGNYMVYLNTGSGFATAQDWGTGEARYVMDTQGRDNTIKMLMDINGDGLPDELYRPYQSVSHGGGRSPTQRPEIIYNLQVRLNTGSGFGLPQDWGTMQGLYLKRTQKHLTIHELIDINGDGLPDDLYRDYKPRTELQPEHIGNLMVRLNTGRGFGPVEDWGTMQGKGIRDTDGRNPIHDLIDINGDGLLDDVYRKQERIPDGLHVAYYRVRLNTGSGFGPVQDWGDGFGRTLSGSDGKGRNGKQLMDINGDGLPDDVSRVPEYRMISSARRNVPFPKPYEARLNLSGPPALLTMVQLPTGGRIQYQYGPSTQFDNTDYTGTPRLANKMWVVTKVTHDDALGTQSSSNITYRGGLYEGFPKCEFRGFREVSITNAMGAKSTTTYLQDDACWGHQSQQSLHDAEGMLLSTSESEWTYRDIEADGTIVFPYVNRSLSKIYDGAETPRVLEQNYTYDDYGNITQILNAGDTNIEGDEVRTTHEYARNIDAWILNRTSRVVVEDKTAGAWNTARDTKTFYDDSAYGTVTTGNPTRVEAWIGPNHGWATVTTGYDTYGNPVWTRDANANAVADWAVNGNGHTVDTKYDPRFQTVPIETQNALNHVESVEYDNLLRPTTAIDANGQRTTTAYDPLGRPTFTTKPGDTQPSVTTEYHNDGIAPEYTVTRSHTAGDQWLANYTLVDGFGRPIQDKVPFGDGFISSDRFYDELGRDTAKSQSYHSTELISVDSADRITEERPLVLLADEFTTVNVDDQGYMQIPGWAQTGNGHPDFEDNAKWTEPTDLDDGEVQLTGGDTTTREIVPTEGHVSAGLETEVDLTHWNRGPLQLTVECGAGYTTHDKHTSCRWFSGGKRCHTSSQQQAHSKPVVLSVLDVNSGNLLHRVELANTTTNLVARGLGKHELDLAPYVAKAKAIRIRLSIDINPEGQDISSYTFRARNIRLVGTQDIVRGILVRDPTQPATRSEYDAAGRVVAVTTPDGASRTTHFDRGTQTITNANGVVFTHHVDAFGRITAIEETIDDTVHTTSYYHRPATGELEQITDAKGNIYSFAYDRLGRKLSEHDADRGQWTYAYDPNGNAIGQTDANQNTTARRYDALNRERILIDHDGQEILYSYDSGDNAIGQRTAVQTPHLARSFSYDQRGRTTARTLSMDGHTWTSKMAYDDLNRLVSMTYPDGEVVHTQYNARSLVNKVTGDDDYVLNASYATFGKLTNIEFGNATSIAYAFYDGTVVDPIAASANSYRLHTITSQGGNVGLSLEYQYDKQGNVLALIDRHQPEHSQFFAYDAANRLRSANGVYGERAYHYDPVGNLKRFDGRTFEYAGNNRLVTDGLWTYDYDNNGNVISRSQADASQKLAFDSLNRMTGITTETGAVENYLYDEGESRIKKTADGEHTYYITADYEEVWKDGVRLEVIKHYYSGKQKIATRDADGLKFIYPDHLHSSSRMADTQGNLVKALWYAPFGATAKELGDAKARYRFTGKERDDTGLYYYGARYYDEAAGRFLSADSLLPNIYDPQQLNRFVYVRNNPLAIIDPDGHEGYFVTSGYYPERYTAQDFQNWLDSGADITNVELDRLMETIDPGGLSGFAGVGMVRAAPTAATTLAKVDIAAVEKLAQGVQWSPKATMNCSNCAVAFSKALETNHVVKANPHQIKFSVNGKLVTVGDDKVVTNMYQTTGRPMGSLVEAEAYIGKLPAGTQGQMAYEANFFVGEHMKMPIHTGHRMNWISLGDGKVAWFDTATKVNKVPGSNPSGISIIKIGDINTDLVKKKGLKNKVHNKNKKD